MGKKSRHIIATVSTVDVFVKTMKFISDNNLWGDVQSYLEDNGKDEMYVDWEALTLVRKLIRSNPQFCDHAGNKLEDTDDIISTLIDHINPFCPTEDC